MKLWHVAGVKILEFIAEDRFSKLENREGLAVITFNDGSRGCTVDQFGRVIWEDKGVK